MSNTDASAEDHYEPGIYEIRIKGHLADRWVYWFEGLTITLEEGGNTLLTGPVVDQSALHGLLRKVRDLGMPLLSVCAIEPGWDDASDIKCKRRRNDDESYCIHRVWTTGSSSPQRGRNTYPRG